MGSERQWRAASRPTDPTSWALTALGVAALALASAWGTLNGVRGALATLGQSSMLADAILVLFGLGCACLLLPALRSFQLASRARESLAKGDVIAARVAGAAARGLAWYSFGFAAALMLILLVMQFLIANNLAVSRTFFMLPLIFNTFLLVLKAFWTNVYIFIVAEVLVLVWGLVIALARLAPGPAGWPIRVMATLYADVFRGLPAIINIYLIGFGIPLTHLPILQDLSQESFAILALTLTYGAYVAEVYRAGIESIHWSQTAAARSLGLSQWQTYRYVVVPQAVRRIMPPLLNDFVALQKDTALVGFVGLIEVLNESNLLNNHYYNLTPITAAAGIFLIPTIPLTRYTDRLLKRQQQRTQAG